MTDVATKPLRKTAKTVFSKTRKDRMVTVQAVVRATGLDSQAVRRHLDNLVAKGLLVRSEANKMTGKRGRPAHQYTRAAV